MSIKINANEKKVLGALVEDSAGNGHDFGFADDIRVDGLSRHQVAGYIGALVSKDLVRITDDEYRQTVIRPSAIKLFESDYDYNHGYWVEEEAWEDINVIE